MDDRWFIVAAAAAALAVFVLRSWLKERKKNKLPTVQIRAEIMSIRLDNRSTRGAYGMTNLIGHYVTFRTADGMLMELTAPEDVGHLPIGTAGTLIYQGKKCERFDAD